MSSNPPPDRGAPKDSQPPDAPERAGDSRRPEVRGERPFAAQGPVARRPRYLLFALIGALVFGAGCWTEGCNRLAFYRGEHDHSATLNASIRDDAERAHAESLYQRFVETSDASKGRAIPMAAATFVLGAALLALAARGLAGRSNTRSALMQVVAAQAIVVCLSYFIMRDMRNAELDWEFERSLIHQHEVLPPDQYRDVVPTVRAMRRWAPPGWLAFRTLASALIFLALSRQGSREFFEATST
jgi:hypothetical protein